MRYPLLVLALLLSLPRWGQAQIATVWDKSYGSALNETAGFTVAMPGGYLLLSNTSYPGTPPVSFNRYLLLVRTNLTGDTLWTKKLVPPSTTQPIPTAVCRDATGNLLVTGFGYEANGRGFLLKLNSTGDTIWTKSSVARTSSYNSPIVAQDGNYAFLERQTAVVSGNLIYSSSVVKVSTANGAVIWRSDLTSVLLASGIDANSTFPTALVGTGNALLCILQGRMLNTPPRGVEATLVLSQAN